MDKNHSKNIYTITVLKVHRERTPGFFWTLADAKFTVENNNLDISEEGYYRYCVIEERKEGTYVIEIPKEWWYEWDHKQGKYLPIDKPEKYNHIICFGLG